MECLNCGEPLHQTPGKRERKFCDSTCRSNYWQKESRRKAKEEGLKPLVIPDCIPKLSAGPAGDMVRQLISQIEELPKRNPLLAIDKDFNTVEVPAGQVATATITLHPFADKKTFSDFLAIIKAGKFDMARLEKEAMESTVLNTRQREMVLAKIRNA